MVRLPPPRRVEAPTSNTSTVAIVDDDLSVRRSLSRLLRAAGYPVETFASARDFFEWLPTHRAACLLLDVRMPEMTGFELQAQLAVPVIFITAYDDVATREGVRKSGAAGHLVEAVRRGRDPRRNPYRCPRGARLMDDEPSLRQKARAKIDGSQIPRRPPKRIWGGALSEVLACAICDAPILSPDITVALVFDRTIGGVVDDVYDVHTRCQAAWEFERGA
jgi:CheY-like chemotaxis protein